MNPSPSEDLRLRWRKEWIINLYEFSRPDLQMASWVKGCEWVSMYAECMCGYFNDLGLDSGYQSAIDHGLVSTEEAGLLAPFHALAERYEQPRRCRSNQDIISDPQWREVVAAAQQSWVALQRVISDPEEVALMASLDARRWDT